MDERISGHACLVFRCDRSCPRRNRDGADCAATGAKKVLDLRWAPRLGLLDVRVGYVGSRTSNLQCVHGGLTTLCGTQFEMNGVLDVEMRSG